MVRPSRNAVKSAPRARPSSPVERRPARANSPQIFGRVWLAMLGGLFLVALAWRIAYLVRLAETPFLTELGSDARIYWDWSGRILAHGLVGTRPFFLGPLYAYGLALLRALTGSSVFGVCVAQAVASAAAVALLADAARRLTRPAIGLAIGALLAFDEMSVFFTGLVLMESLLFFLEALLLWLVVRADAKKPRAPVLLAIGVLIGLLAAGRPTQLVLLAPAALLVVAASDVRVRLRTAALVLAGALLPLAPIALHNLEVARAWIPITYSGGYNFAVGNQPHATGGWSDLTAPPDLTHPDANEAGASIDGHDVVARALGHAPTANETSRWWSQQAWNSIAKNPARTLRLDLRKIGMLWNRREYPQIENRDVYRRIAGPLGIPGLGSFALLGALALAGAAFARGFGTGGRFALGYAISLTAVLVPFFVTDRYRHHLLPAVALLAAIAIERLWRAVRGGSHASLGGALLVVLGGAIVVNLPAPHFSPERERWGIADDIGSRWLQRGRADLALPWLEEAVEWEARDAANGGATAGTRFERADLHFQYGLALLVTGRKADARPWLERAAQEEPGNPQIDAALRAAGSP